jgi:hypothetical protein
MATAGLLQVTAWPEALIAFSGITMITVIASVAIWQGFLSWRARMSAAQEEAYRQLAEENLSAQARLATQQQHLADGMKDLQSRIVDIERILKEVG